ncbi:MAG: dTDP-4-dehydrorhamnose reductase [Acidothermus sp.]|nr:dTDP-4-dehydrorhamnose reductase [Acidothermus sp.]
MSRWLITGAGGQLGSDLVAVLRAAGEDVVGFHHADLDITDVAAVDGVFREIRPDVVVNAAAYTAVDAAESDPETAFAVNATGAGTVAAAASRSGGLLVHVSTDYVFAGDATEPYDEDDPVAPRSVYGKSKAEGERLVLKAHPSAYVVRTAWVYGAVGSNFVKTMARLERERETVSVVDDQRGSPTWSRDLAGGIVDLVRREPSPGIYHCTNTGETTWFGFARAIFEELGAEPGRVHPTTTEAFPRPAPRPAYSVLGHRRWQEAGLAPMRHWRDALTQAFRECSDALRLGSES